MRKFSEMMGMTQEEIMDLELSEEGLRELRDTNPAAYEALISELTEIINAYEDKSGKTVH